MNQAHQGEREGSASSERQNSSERDRESERAFDDALLLA